MPSSEARKATIARASPVSSISRPRNTNIGTASSTGCDIPWSSRFSTTLTGTVVVSIR